MTHPNTQVARQLADELARAIVPIVAVLGLDLDEILQERIHAAAPILAAQITSTDDEEAAEAVQLALTAIWGECEPPADWWRTPLGRACARSLGRDDSESVTHAVAAAMLGVARGTVSVMVHRGTLDRHPDGGVLRASVMQRLARD